MTSSSPSSAPSPQADLEVIELVLDAAVEPGDVPNLTDQQMRALLTLTTGRSLSAAARAANVHRGTVMRWLRHNDHFAAMYNAWQVELRDQARVRLLGSIQQAVDVVIGSLQSHDARTALTLLKRLAVLDPITPGPTTAADVKKDRELEAKVKDTQRQVNELLIRLGWTSK